MLRRDRLNFDLCVAALAQERFLKTFFAPQRMQQLRLTSPVVHGCVCDSGSCGKLDVTKKGRVPAEMNLIKDFRERRGRKRTQLST